LVYYLHATTPLVFGTLFVVYYSAIPLAFILWFIKYRKYITSGQYKIKELVAFVLIALLATSTSLFLMLDKYIYLHSPEKSGILLKGSDIYSSHVLKDYGISPQELKKFGVPSYGVMIAYRMVDTVLPEKSLVTHVDSIVVLRMIPFVPAVKVYDYKVEGNRVVGLRTFYVVWPEQPGTVLTREYKALFTIFTNLGGGGGGGRMM